MLVFALDGKETIVIFHIVDDETKKDTNVFKVPCSFPNAYFMFLTGELQSHHRQLVRQRASMHCS